ncbi:hypothetical protein C8Q69DRAFT_307150 [Paecilomyces variotii]|uniref:Uncharacterized protein n=1 Tax=Byssochlamys spectabilis TaxID=264951 RepID=A0A443HPV0_BYSSP|nr:hypothetical protein C8Q69DRAFT_307150 [Paecilomyces variotii]RWQ93863.1 hypothetical protein C8Q69DRAFT_307150 [Paecilomyces variotii]
MFLGINSFLWIIAFGKHFIAYPISQNKMIGFVTTKWEYGYIPGPQSKISSVQTLQISITSRIGWAYTKQSGFLQRKCNKTSRQAGELYETQAPELKCLSYEEYLLIVEQLFANRMGWTCGENMDQICGKARESL